MPQKFLRRAVCGLTAFALISCPCAALAQSDSGSALAPIESALEHLRSEASQWLTSLRVRLTAAEPTAEASNQDAKRLIPGGQNIGVAMVCEGVLVVGTSDPGAAQSPARLAGIRSGDTITHVNDVPVVGADQFS